MDVLPSLQQLRFLCALAEQRHFGRAAESCAVTQSTLSGGIKELEARLGIALFERSHRHVMLTPFGERDRDPRPASAGRRRGTGRVGPQRAGG
jgi:LysR family hydrogen peroxide-inducible transcriptional activator